MGVVFNVWAQWKQNPKLFYECTHATVEEFKCIHHELQPYITQPWASVVKKLAGPCQLAQLSAKNRLLLALFGMNGVFTSREIHHIIPIICWCFQHKIMWPSAHHCQLLEGSFPDVSQQMIFSMDFMTHPISEPVKELKHNYFHSNKHKHYFNSLGMVDCCGLFLHFKPGFARHANNQQGFVLSALGQGELPLDPGQTGIVDSGFSANDNRILTPYHDNQGRQCSSQQFKANSVWC